MRKFIIISITALMLSGCQLSHKQIAILSVGAMVVLHSMSDTDESFISRVEKGIEPKLLLCSDCESQRDISN